jgi:DNA-binding YbaB/EbfC family protein
MDNIKEMMAAAQAASDMINKHMEEAQHKLDAIEVEGLSGGGLVKIRCSAKGKVNGVSVDESLLTPAEKTILEDLVAAAFNDARDRADRVSEQQMREMQGSMGLPPGFNLPGLG